MCHFIVRFSRLNNNELWLALSLKLCTIAEKITK